MNRARRFVPVLALAVFLVGGGASARPDRGTVLRVAVAKGVGRVMTSDGRLNCRTRCSIRYQRGTIRRLTAKPAAHYLFTRWSGDCIGTAPNCDVALDRATSVRAGFVGEWSGVVISVGGPGRVTSVEGINCGEGSHVCSLGLRYATKVTLIPHPGSDGRFAAWDGPCAAAGTGPCTVRVGSPLSETAAAFGHSSPQAGDQPLTVTLHNSFPRVTSQPAGIVCPPTCQASFPSGTIVTLLTYDGIWAGACTGETLQRCALVIDAPTEVGVICSTSAATGGTAPPPGLCGCNRVGSGSRHLEWTGVSNVASPRGLASSATRSFGCLDRGASCRCGRIPGRARASSAGAARAEEGNRPACSQSSARASPRRCSR